MPNVIDNITEYESMNAYRIGYLKLEMDRKLIYRDDSFRFFNPFDHGIIRNCMEFFHLSTDWWGFENDISYRMSTFYYCLMDIPDHPLRVKGLAYLQQKSEKTKETCACPKCGTQLDRPKEGVILQCTCGFVFSI